MRLSWTPARMVWTLALALACVASAAAQTWPSKENWVRGPMLRLLADFQQSLKAHPPVPPGAPDDYRAG